MKRKKIAEAIAEVLEMYGWDVREQEIFHCSDCNASVSPHSNFCHECGKGLDPLKEGEQMPVLVEQLIDAYKAGKKADK